MMFSSTIALFKFFHLTTREGTFCLAVHKRAPQTASLWAEGGYSSYAFRQLVVELGIVGRVRQIDEKQGIIEADFEYATTTRLPLLVTDDCVIHPMFYKKLNIKKTKKLCVYPFPDHAEFKFEEIFEAL